MADPGPDQVYLVIGCGPVGLAVIASAPMAALVFWLREMGVAVVPAILSGALVFGVALLAVKGVGREDLRLISALRAAK